MIKMPGKLNNRSIILQEEISWRKKSRVLWLKEGDECTVFSSDC